MSRVLLAPIACVLAAFSLHVPAQAGGRVEVQYVKPEQFSDAGRFSTDREHTLKSFSEYFQTLATRLPDGQTLKLEVLDIDLAGELRPARNGFEIRVLRGRADWPHMTLRYTLQGPAGMLKSGQAELADMSYLDFNVEHGMNQGDLPYEKRMVQRWFDRTIVAP